jgi:hypothetical protein
VALAEKWWRLEHELPAGWREARLVLHADGDTYCERATALLGPANPVRHGTRITFYAAQHGAAGIGPKAVARLLTRLDEEGIRGDLELVSVAEGTPKPEQEDRWLADDWEALVAGLPEDWSDVYAQISLDSSDYFEPGALALSPVNPARVPGTNAFRFRSARRFGYGASPTMVRRCLERLDERGITGEVEILRALSDTKPVGTQGPVWYVGGKSV